MPCGERLLTGRDELDDFRPEEPEPHQPADVTFAHAQKDYLILAPQSSEDLCDGLHLLFSSTVN